MSIQTIINGMGRIDSSLNTYGLKDDDIQHVINMFGYQEGVLDSGNDDFEVNATSPASMDVEVNKGQAIIANDSYVYASHTTKYWYVKSDATETVTISANTSGNDRIDIIVLKVDTSASPDDEASNVVTVEAVEGTPSASPVAPSTPSNALKLAEIYVSNGTSSITSSDITDTRTNLLMDWYYLDSRQYMENGWIPISLQRHTFAYDSDISHSSLYQKYKIAVDDTALYRIGDKIRVYDANDTTTKYFVVTQITAGYIEILSMFDSPTSSTLYSLSSSSNITQVLVSKGMPSDFPLSHGIDAGAPLVTLEVDTSVGHSSAHDWETVKLKGGTNKSYNPFKLFAASYDAYKIYIPFNGVIHVEAMLRWSDGNTAATFGLVANKNGTSAYAADFTEKDGGLRAVNKYTEDIDVADGDYIEIETFNDLGASSIYASGYIMISCRTVYNSTTQYNQG